MCWVPPTASGSDRSAAAQGDHRDARQELVDSVVTLPVPSGNMSSASALRQDLERGLERLAVARPAVDRERTERR